MKCIGRRWITVPPGMPTPTDPTHEHEWDEGADLSRLRRAAGGAASGTRALATGAGRSSTSAGLATNAGLGCATTAASAPALGSGPSPRQPRGAPNTDKTLEDNV